MHRWASNDEAERQAAVKHWKRAIDIAVEMEVDTMNSEFGRGPHPDKGSCYCCHTGSMIEACEDAWWRSMEEIVPILEREGINLHVEPHPEDWCETIQPALDIIRTVNIPRVRFLHCAPHAFYFGDDTVAMLREARDVLAYVHVGDTFNHEASSGLRYILNPPSTQARVHQHLNIGQGEVPSDDFFGTLAEIAFEHLVAALTALKPILNARGLVGLLEPLGFPGSSLRLKADAIRAIEAAGGRGTFKLVHDTFHHHPAGETELFPEWTGLVHMSGVTDPEVAVEDMLDAHRVLADGDDRLGNLAQIRALLAAGFGGPFSFEPFATEVYDLADPGQALRESLGFIQSGLRRLAA